MQVFVIMSNVGIMINAENLVFDNADGYIKKKEENRNKYLVVVFKDQNKAVLSKSTKRWDWFKNLIEKKKKVENQGEYKKEFIKIRLEWDDNLSLNKKLKLHNLTIVINSVF